MFYLPLKYSKPVGSMATYHYYTKLCYLRSGLIWQWLMISEQFTSTNSATDVSFFTITITFALIFQYFAWSFTVHKLVLTLYWQAVKDYVAPHNNVFFMCLSISRQLVQKEKSLLTKTHTVFLRLIPGEINIVITLLYPAIKQGRESFESGK